jgi:hypothetical protein
MRKTRLAAPSFRAQTLTLLAGCTGDFLSNARDKSCAQ